MRPYSGGAVNASPAVRSAGEFDDDERFGGERIDRERLGDRVTGLLTGIIVLGTGVYFVTVLEAPIGPPVESSPLFVWTTTAAAMAFVLLGRGHRLGYPVAIVTGLLVVTAIALIGSGTYGPVGASSSPLGPLSFLALGLGVIATTVAAWRRRRHGGVAPDTAASTR